MRLPDCVICQIGCQIVGFARLPDWLWRQIGLGVPDCNLCQIARLRNKPDRGSSEQQASRRDLKYEFPDWHGCQIGGRQSALSLPDWPDCADCQIARLRQIAEFARLPDWVCQIGARLPSTTQKQQLWNCSQARTHQVLLRKQILSQQQKENISTTTVSLNNTHHRNDNCLIHRITTPKSNVEKLNLRAQLPACRQCKLIQ